MGYHRAGFKRIVGVDNRPQPNYPFEFILADAMTFPLEGFDLIHASPPCQGYSSLQHLPHPDRDYPRLIEPLRERLLTNKAHWVIENVPGAPLRNPLRLCGSVLCPELPDGARLRRHRLFETSFSVDSIPCQHRGQTLGVYGDMRRSRRSGMLRGTKAGLAEAEMLMGIDWMDDRELVQAIPPAYTYWIGCQAMVYLGYDKKDSFVYGGWLPAEALRAEPLLAPLQADEAARDNRSLRADTEALL